MKKSINMYHKTRIIAINPLKCCSSIHLEINQSIYVPKHRFWQCFFKMLSLKYCLTIHIKNTRSYFVLISDNCFYLKQCCSTNGNTLFLATLDLFKRLISVCILGRKTQRSVIVVHSGGKVPSKGKFLTRTTKIRNLPVRIKSLSVTLSGQKFTWLHLIYLRKCAHSPDNVEIYDLIGTQNQFEDSVVCDKKFVSPPAVPNTQSLLLCFGDKSRWKRCSVVTWQLCAHQVCRRLDKNMFVL